MKLALARALVEVASMYGAPRPKLLAALGVDDVSDEHARLPIARVFDAWDLAMRAVRDPALPIHVGRLTTVRRLGLLGYALYTSPTLRDALHALARYHDLINDSGRWSIAEAPSGATIRWARDDADLSLGARAANEQVLASFAAVLREGAAPDARVLEVRLRSPKPARTTAHDDHFAAPITWGASEWAVLLAPGDLEAPVRGSDALLSEYFQTKIAGEVVRRGTASEVASVVATLLASGIPSLATIAARLGTSERTLRRRLADEDTSFDAVVRDVQLDRSRGLLEAGERVREVAFATGFSDASAFSRAYRRWTGEPPISVRRR